MEKWKIAAIAALLLSLVGFGLFQQQGERPSAATTPTGGPVTGGSVTAPTPNPIAALYNGQSLPEWKFPRWQNTTKPPTAASLPGQTTLVEIFRTGCSHCNEAAPLMAAINTRYGPRGLKMIGIQSPGDFKNPENPENNWADVQTWVKENRLKYPIAFDEKSNYFQGTIRKEILKDDAARLLYPMTMVVGPDGKISYSQSGHDTPKAIELAVQLEKRFPTSKDGQKNAADLVKWLSGLLPELQFDANMIKAMTDDVAQRLK
jgi:thiol-disulfide isomerase/thioredoxin